MPRQRKDPPDLSTQAGRLVWARAAAGYPSSRVAARILRFNENRYKSHETGERGKKGIPVDDLQAYSKAYKVDLTWLAFGTGSPHPGIKVEQDEWPPAIRTGVRKVA